MDSMPTNFIKGDCSMRHDILPSDVAAGSAQVQLRLSAGVGQVLGFVPHKS